MITQVHREWISAKNLLLLSWIGFWISAGVIAVGCFIAVTGQPEQGLFFSFSGFIGLGLAGMLMVRAVDRGGGER